VRYLYVVTNDLALDRQVCFALYAASRAATAVYRPVLDELGLTYPQYLVLLVLWERDSRGVRELGDELSLDSGTLSPLLKRLEALELIERRRVSTDERRVEVHLTDTGKALQAKACIVPQTLLEATEMSPDELANLHEVLGRLTDSLHSYTKREG